MENFKVIILSFGLVLITSMFFIYAVPAIKGPGCRNQDLIDTSECLRDYTFKQFGKLAKERGFDVEIIDDGQAVMSIMRNEEGACVLDSRLSLNCFLDKIMEETIWMNGTSP